MRQSGLARSDNRLGAVGDLQLAKDAGDLVAHRLGVDHQLLGDQTQFRAKTMNSEMQRRIAEFVDQNGLKAGVAYRILDLVSEVGELSKELLKATEYGKRDHQPTEISVNWEEELGDVLFALICVANSTGVDLEHALTKVLQKYQQRVESKRDPASGR